MVEKAAQALLDHWQLGNVLAVDCPSRPILQHLTNRWGTLVMVAENASSFDALEHVWRDAIEGPADIAAGSP